MELCSTIVVNSKLNSSLAPKPAKSNRLGGSQGLGEARDKEGQGGPI
jgi:hypothetical protein